MNRNLSGWIRQKHDPRDFRISPPPRLLRNLSPSVDLASGMGPQLDQGQEGSCGPNTSAEMITFDQIAEGAIPFTPSRQFIYYNCRVAMGTVGQDSGVDNRTLLSTLSKTGYCPESLWPYLPSNLTTQPSASCYQAALPNVITNYVAVNQDLTTMQATIAARHPFMFGFSVFQQMMSDQASQTGIIDDPTGESIGGHDVTFVGYNSGSSALPGIKPGNIWPSNTFKFRNHWMNSDGTPWGDGGYGYISYTYATNPTYASDFWVINAVNIINPSPTPVPSALTISFNAPESGHLIILGGGKISQATIIGSVNPGVYSLVPQ